MATARTSALLHSPFLGPSCWEAVGQSLREKGQRTLVLDVRGALEAGRDFHDAFGALAARQVDGPMILVAHGGAGALTPAISRGAEGLIEATIFVDALLPHPGRAWFDTVPAAFAARVRAKAVNGRARPWPEWLPKDALARLLPDPVLRQSLIHDAPAVPLRFLDEAAPEGRHWQEVFGSAYLQLSSNYDAEAEMARALGWPVRRFDGHHLSPMTDPAGVAETIIDLATR